MGRKHWIPQKCTQMFPFLAIFQLVEKVKIAAFSLIFNPGYTAYVMLKSRFWFVFRKGVLKYFISLSGDLWPWSWARRAQISVIFSALSLADFKASSVVNPKETWEGNKKDEDYKKE